ncbi:Helix-turn-helix [Carboxydocella sporoproducens DSM 16521]|uniref:Helix-turn-helix n=2 Tax=Carboxydocella TaxID=178898 RepID=A0A1T4QDH7_9FIRM|nr:MULTISPECIES: helix-turn-helix transcriptional regulator [Carboxydocella]AVX21632.1 helix-turn-helix protein [Carboxydocella thermautotrophica]SKA01789.1 Helix-turn-helix [Carboxydocella sporoproducens DSM 16521]
MHIGTAIERVRKERKVTRTELGRKVGLSPRTIESYETGKQVPPPDVVMIISKYLRIPWLTQEYCKRHCAIGQKYSYVMLTGVNLDPASIMLKLISEMKEAEAVLHRMLEILVNKNGREDFLPAEWDEFIECLHEFLDVEHNIETLKISLGEWCDVSELIQQHNNKCWQKGYLRKNEAALAAY